jgi:hypothetical protein
METMPPDWEQAAIDRMLTWHRGAGERFRRERHRHRWRRRAVLLVKRAIFPLGAVVVFPLLSIANFYVARYVWGIMATMMICYFVGGIGSASVAFALIFARLLWIMQAHPLENWMAWAWWVTFLFTYACLLALMPVTASSRTDRFLPRLAQAFLHRPQA